MAMKAASGIGKLPEGVGWSDYVYCISDATPFLYCSELINVDRIKPWSQQQFTWVEIIDDFQYSDFRIVRCPTTRDTDYDEASDSDDDYDDLPPLDF